MSKSAKEAAHGQETAPSKSERRGRTEEERSKSKKTKLETTDSTDEATETPAKKRKRDTLPDEIEINVDLPEPSSKKAARKAKKAKLNPAAAESETLQAAGDAAEEKAAKRSDFGVWIGNLPWSATKDSLRAFLVDHAEMKSEHITRIHLPPPTKPPNPNWTTKPLNKGFAYVDFSTELAMYSAIALTETKMDGRALLIKNAKSFEGRPDKPKTDEPQDTARGKGKAKSSHPPNKRVFVGNLSFDVTKDDLQTHYEQCGPVEHIHMATFEDSGKCKGYAWITFGDVDTAACAVNGFVFKTEAEIQRHKSKEQDGPAEELDAIKGNKRRKWLLNKLNGRELRCEFAEDSTTRYNKRYGKEKEPHEAVDGVNPDRWKNFSKPRREWPSRERVDARTIKSGAAHANAPRASQAIVAPQGKRTTFE